MRLVCFPHAGGSASVYHRWPALLDDRVEVVAVQYPGRADRFSEALLPEVSALADGVVQALAHEGDDRPVALFGHSMGALVAYEVARRTPVRHLFVSAALAPGDRGDRPPLSHPDDDTQVALLSELGGQGMAALADPELRELVLPYVRADLRAVEDYVRAPGPSLTCPVTAMTGEQDVRARPDAVRRWQAMTEGEFAFHGFDGGHFYLEDDPSLPLRAVQASLLAVDRIA